MTFGKVDTNISYPFALHGFGGDVGIALGHGGGLYLHVSPAGGKLWRMAYRFEGKQKTLSFGAYPAVGLKDARSRREEAKAMLAAGVDLGAHKKAVKEAVRAEEHNNYETIAREWHAKYSDVWTDSARIKVLARQANHIFPQLGGKPIHQVTAPELLAVLRMVEGRVSPRRGAPNVAGL